MIGIILAAGDGVRLKNSTGQNSCKVLNKIDDKYLIQHALDNLSELDVQVCIIVVGSFADDIKNAVTDNYNGIKICYVRQAIRNGVINALMCALPEITDGEAVILQLADEIFDEFDATNIKTIVEKAEYDFYCGITYEENSEKIKANYSVETDCDMLLSSCIEKPKKTINNMKGTGFCVFGAESIEILKSIYREEDNNPCDLCDFMNYLISHGKKGLCVPVAEKEFNINTIEELKQARDYFSEQR